MLIFNDEHFETGSFLGVLIKIVLLSTLYVLYVLMQTL